MSQRRVELTAYLLLGCLLLTAALFHLGPALLTGFFSFIFLRFLDRLFVRTVPPLASRWLSLLAFLILAALTAWISVNFVIQGLAAVPDILSQSIPRLNGLAVQYGFDFHFETIEDIRAAVIGALKENAGNITQSSRLLSRGFFHLMIGAVISILCFMDAGERPVRTDLYEALGSSLRGHIRKFANSFEQVMGAQVVISLVNTLLTIAFLVCFGFPHVFFLALATFVLGLLPIIGNLFSNTLIVVTALTISPRLSLFALAFLLLIHKGEYFLNSKIVGRNLRVPMWQNLLAVLIGHVVLGVPGIMLAPALLHYLRAELREVPFPAAHG